MKYTVNDFIKSTINIDKYPISILTSILTLEEANANIINYGTLITCSSHKDKVIFFTNNHLFNYGLLSSEFVASTVCIPMNVVPREGLEDGIVKDAEDYLRIFYKDCRLITSVDDLVDFLNKRGKT